MFRNEMEKRLKDFTCNVIKSCSKLPNNETKRILFNQITRSGISVSLNFAESQSAESKKDFIHKLSISLKELRETKMALEIIIDLFDNYNVKDIRKQLSESNELISILVKSIQSARKNK